MDSKTLLREVRRTPVKFIPARPPVSPYPGEWPSPFEGKGFEPRGFRDFQLGDNPRHIHIPTTARRGVPTIIERTALRDVKVMVLLDGSPSMRLREKLDAQIACAALLLYWGWKSETTFGLAIRTGDRCESFGLGVGSRHFYRLYRQLFELADTGTTTRRGVAAPLRHLLPSSAIVVCCSDFLAPDGEIDDLQDLWRNVQRYDFVPVIIQDDLECSFPKLEAGSFVAFRNPETRGFGEIWVSPQRAEKIRELHEERFETLREAFGRRGLKSVHLDSASVREVAKRIDRFFRQRRKR